jgi:hypothetical protein
MPLPLRWESLGARGRAPGGALRFPAAGLCGRGNFCVPVPFLGMPSASGSSEIGSKHGNIF